ncbi:beta-N-acetylhexosaminidase [Planctomycetota bacterium]
MKIRYAFLLLCLSSPAQADVTIIPQPAEATALDGFFEIRRTTTVSVENEEQAAVVTLFLNHFKRVAGWQPTVETGAVNADIVFKTDTALPTEAYGLTVSPQRIEVKANSGAGFFYALQSLALLLPVEFFADTVQSSVNWVVPAIDIKDAPAFGWRGYMLDVSRHFFTVDQLKSVIDFMAELKLNRLHLHLSDDQGWRIEIKGLPKLTEVGAWRADRTTTDETVNNWWGRPVQKPSEKATYGGFYTQEQMKTLIAYAKARYIEVVPEIDIPGHAQAAVASYPEIGCVNAALTVGTGGVNKNNTLNPGKEETFEFCEVVLNELMDLFPFDYIHIGGDECNKEQWRQDPHAQKRIQDEGLKDERELQCYFIKRIEKIINARGKKMIGWDEILEGGLAPNATVMSWRGEKGGINAAKAGHEVIMTPFKYCYLDLKQGHDDLEPNLGYGQLLLSTAYSYRVIPQGFTEAQARLIKGIQGNLWTESISDWGKLNYMTFPRLYAVAENAWTQERNKNWDSFTDRLSSQFKRFDLQGRRYATSAFNPWIDHDGNGEMICVRLKTEANGLNMRYTLDGTEPTVHSKLYDEPFYLRESTTVKAQSFKDGKKIGALSAKLFQVHKASGAKAYSHGKEGRKAYPQLTDLNYGKLSKTDRRWQKFPNTMEVEVVLDQVTSVSSVELDALRFSISGHYAPHTVEVLGSQDGTTYVPLGRVEQSELGLVQGRNKIRTRIEFDPVKLRSLKVKAATHQKIPQGHHQAGNSATLLVDEIVVH